MNPAGSDVQRPTLQGLVHVTGLLLCHVPHCFGVSMPSDMAPTAFKQFTASPPGQVVFSLGVVQLLQPALIRAGNTHGSHV